MSYQNLSSARNEQPNPNSQGGSVIGWLALIAVGFGIWWVYNRKEERAAQRKREIMREVNWVVTRDHVDMYKTSPNQDVGQRLKAIDSRYSRPIWEDVPEDHSGKGRIIIRP